MSPARHFHVGMRMVDSCEPPPALQRDVFWDQVSYSTSSRHRPAGCPPKPDTPLFSLSVYYWSPPKFSTYIYYVKKSGGNQ